jgi:hypothetical protein
VKRRVVDPEVLITVSGEIAAAAVDTRTGA